MATVEDEDFLAGLVRSPLDQYEERRRYWGYVDENPEYELLDTIRKNKLYGAVDHEFYIIQPNTILRTFGEIADEVVGLNYTVSAFEQFHEKYSRMISQGITSPPDTIADISPVKSYVDFEESYIAYQLVVTQLALTLLLQENSDHLEFVDFFEKFMETIFHEDIKVYNFTKTGFVLSRDFSVFSTGLYIDLGNNLSPQIDFEKGRMIRHSGFECFLQTAKEAGFYVDVNAPWRLVVNLSSPTIQSNILNGRPAQQFEDFMSDMYGKRIGLDDYWLFKSLAARLYYDFLAANGHPAESRGDALVNTVSEEDWIKAYIQVRWRELGLCTAEDFFSPESSPTDNKRRVIDIYANSIDRLQDPRYNELSGNHGPLAFIEKEFTVDLRKIIRK